MSSRERWIVYPLVFYALAISLKPKFVPADIKCHSLRCANVTVQNLDANLVNSNNLNTETGTIERGLTVLNPAGRPAVVIGSDLSRQNAPRFYAGKIQVYGADGKMSAQIGTQRNMLTGDVAVRSANRNSAIHLGSHNKIGWIHNVIDSKTNDIRQVTAELPGQQPFVIGYVLNQVPTPPVTKPAPPDVKD